MRAIVGSDTFFRKAGLLIFLYLILSCGERGDPFSLPGFPSAPPSSGRVGVRLSPRIAPDYVVSRVMIEFSPDGIIGQLSYDSTSQLFSGVFTLVEGPHTVIATVYAVPTTAPRGSQREEVIVGSGTASFTVIANATVGVYLVISDTTDALPPVDAGPIILSVSVSNLTPRRLEVVTIAVDARDPNGDPLTYQFSQDCTFGVFSAPNSFVTEWYGRETGTCMISILASSGSLSDLYSFTIEVFPALGEAQITVDYLPNPAITLIELDTSQGACVVTHSDTNATCPYSLSPGSSYYLYVEVNWGVNPPVQAGAITIRDNCGGSFTPSSSCDGSASFCDGFFTAPSTTSVCLITATVQHYNLTDSLSMGVAVQ